MVLVSFCGIKAENCIKMGVPWAAAVLGLASNARHPFHCPEKPAVELSASKLPAKLRSRMTIEPDVICVSHGDSTA